MAAIGSELEVANHARSQLGQGGLLTSTDNTIANIVETGEEKDQLVLWYPTCREALLTGFFWRFARRFTTLTKVADGDDGATYEWGKEWAYAYEYPSDCLEVRRFVEDVDPLATYPARACKPGLRQPDYYFEIGQHENDRVIFANIREEDAKIVYTGNMTNVGMFDPMFAVGLVHMLAAYLAPTLGVSPELQAHNLGLYQSWLMRAKAYSANEERRPPDARSAFRYARGGM